MGSVDGWHRWQRSPPGSASPRRQNEQASHPDGSPWAHGTEVWGYDFDPGSNVVEVCVRRLRQKLGPEAAIETVRNAGYRLATA